MSRFRFRLGTTKPLTVSVVPRSQGGLLEGWRLSGPDAQGYYTLSGERPLEFGDFGLLFRVEVRDITGPGLAVPVEFDNSIYRGRASFTYPELVVVGKVPPRVVINPLSEGRARTTTPSFSGTAISPVPSWPVAAVEFRVDGGEWASAQAADGAFDSPREAFKFTVPQSLAEGSHVVEARAQNSAGEWSQGVRYAFVVDTGPWRRYDFNAGVWPADFSRIGTLSWKFDANFTYEGAYSLRSPMLGNWEAAGISLTLDIPSATTLSFRYLVSSQAGADWLVFRVDGEEVERWSGPMAPEWQEYTYQVPPGRHEFSWVYTKDGDGFAGYDAAWIDYIVIK